MPEITTKGPTPTVTPVVVSTSNGAHQVPLPTTPPISPPTEPPKDPATTAAPKQSDDVVKFQQLARKEKAMREKERAIEAKEAALAAREKEIESAKGWQMRLTNEPLKVLNEAGITYEQLTNHILSQGNQADPQLIKLQSELENLKKQLDERDNLAKESQTKQYQQALKQISTDVDVLVKDNPSYELISSMNTQAAVVKLIEETFNQDGYLMSVDSAAQEVENWLEEQMMLGVKSKKIQQKLTPLTPVDETKPVQPQQKPLTTITNQIVQASTKPRTEAERRARAIAVAEGKIPPS